MMKNQLISPIALLATIGLFLMTNCKKSSVAPNPMNCAKNSESLNKALTDFVATPNNTTCAKYKDAIRDFFKSCPTYYSGVTKKDLEEFLAEPCDI
ncbi:hypothetical protein [Dyadobacter tibetensis]|uniref:hypothetical protein n=1 Tax=Dyadobacter tibetensis TaxID=1211851 RepID=UPI0004AD0A37|nr:hypothetical protein [Dyadobacter tibetensis]